MKALYIIFCILFCATLSADDRCMDNSYHADPACGARYDYKNYHPVKCTCRCERYVHLLNRGMCRRCGHYRKPTELKLTKR